MDKINPEIKHFVFRNKENFHQQITKDPNFIKSILDIRDSAEMSYSFNKNGFYEFYKSSLKKGGSIFFLYNGKEVIGAIFGYNNRFASREFTMSFVAIKRQFQNMGLGEKFLKKAYLELKKLGYTQISMFETSKAIIRTNEKIVSKNPHYKKEKRNGTLIKLRRNVK